MWFQPVTLRIVKLRLLFKIKFVSTFIFIHLISISVITFLQYNKKLSSENVNGIFFILRTMLWKKNLKSKDEMTLYLCRQTHELFHVQSPYRFLHNSMIWEINMTVLYRTPLIKA